VHVGNADRLEKFTGKLPRDNLFGNLVHLWLYDPALIRPDRSNRVAWVLVDGVDDPIGPAEAIWDTGLGALQAALAGSFAGYLAAGPDRPVPDRGSVEVVTLMREPTAYPPLGRIAMPPERCPQTVSSAAFPDHFPEIVSGMVKVFRPGD
jgi:hypothetical protein